MAQQQQEPEVLLSIDNHIATITLNRPRKGNALTANMNELLLDMLAKLKEDASVRVLVLTGAGKFFCTGMDLSASSKSVDDPQQVREGFRKGLRVFDALYHFPKPVIARVNGPALGGGVGLIFTTDFRVVAEEETYVALTEVKRGIIPAIISQYLVPELGRQRAREWMLTGRRVPAREAAAYWTSVVPRNQLDQGVQKVIDMLVESAPGASADIKRLVHAISTGGNPEQHQQHVQQSVEDAYLKMMQSDEAVFGIMAFLNKEKPDWNQFLKDKAKL